MVCLVLENDVVQVHVDPLGGWSGDMFVAACLDARPALWPEVRAAIDALKLGPSVECGLKAHSDGVLAGRRFLVAAESVRVHEPSAPHGARSHDRAAAEHNRYRHAHDHRDHPDRAWRDIREVLTTAPLDKSVVAHAVGIFALLAKAEAEVHGVDEEAVTFHEIGAVDSMVDIVAAAVLIGRFSATRWSAAPLPLGGGRVETAHGVLPVPAPATAVLLRGLPIIDDGIDGERVTPTGAAVARYLLDGAPRSGEAPRTIRAVGTGFGARTFPGISNCLRVVLFDEVPIHSPAGSSTLHEEVAVIEFEIDDQSAEDLSLGLDNLRALEGVLDVVQSAVFGKRGRVATQVRVLAAPERLNEIIRACFLETTTIGLRHHLVRRAVLARLTEEVEVDGQRLRVKMAMRPDGQATGKAEAVDVAGQSGRSWRSALRRAGEAEALARLSSKRNESGE
jgi:pyridinium-3,5-bisthiocarboxylic acid mononucleotide nickel chelatase